MPAPTQRTWADIETAGHRNHSNSMNVTLRTGNNTGLPPSKARLEQSGRGRNACEMLLVETLAHDSGPANERYVQI